jgi:hypothetical protein
MATMKNTVIRNHSSQSQSQLPPAQCQIKISQWCAKGGRVPRVWCEGPYAATITIVITIMIIVIIIISPSLPFIIMIMVIIIITAIHITIIIMMIVIMFITTPASSSS